MLDGATETWRIERAFKGIMAVFEDHLLHKCIYAMLKWLPHEK